MKEKLIHLLIGLLSRIVYLRIKMALEEREEKKESKEYKIYPLRMVIMSATLKITDFIG